MTGSTSVEPGLPLSFYTISIFLLNMEVQVVQLISKLDRRVKGLKGGGYLFQRIPMYGKYMYTLPTQ